VSVDGGYPIRQILVALVVLTALYLDFNIYQTGNVWVALALLVVIGLGAFVYLSDAGYTYRYLFPGFLGFGLFVIFRSSTWCF
jgi:maltose/maltodextrin transport system permease protein